ncbi:MAG: polymerase delta prime subunit [Chthonomonadaceae bacterium]|nr:polymerase delta prime subunit [Chthonomonadaceae bacterium]
MPFLDSLVGQEAAVSALRKALEGGTLPGAYLFLGAPGVGKGTLARAFAQAVACTNPRLSPFDACGECESCRRMEAGTQPEIITVQPAGDQMQIWQFWDRDNRPTRGVLSHTLNYAPSIGAKRVYIIERADTLNEAAANSLLKVLEEPPPYALFVLLAPHAARVLPTIASRSQMIRVNAMTRQELTAYLQERIGVEPERATMLAAYSEGRIGQAVQLARSPNAVEEIAKVLDFAEGLAQAPRVRALRLAEQMRKLSGQIKALLGEEPAANADAAGSEEDDAPTGKEKTGRRQLAAIFDLLVVFYRDLLTLRVGGSPESVINSDRVRRLTQLAQAGEPERWMRCLNALLLARRRLDANANIALVTEVLAMKLVQ